MLGVGYGKESSDANKSTFPVSEKDLIGKLVLDDGTADLDVKDKVRDEWAKIDKGVITEFHYNLNENRFSLVYINTSTKLNTNVSNRTSLPLTIVKNGGDKMEFLVREEERLTKLIITPERWEGEVENLKNHLQYSGKCSDLPVFFRVKNIWEEQKKE